MSEHLRQRMMRRWQKRPGPPVTVRAFWILDHWRWIDRYNDWHVARYGECGPEPWWLRPVSHVVTRCDDWRTAFAMRFGSPFDAEEGKPHEH